MRSAALPVAIVVSGLILAVGVYTFVSSGGANAPMSEKNITLVRPVGPDDHIFGNPAAKVVIIEYSDFDCTFCKTYNDTLSQVVASEGATGKVALVYREFPLSEIHPNALKHARAAECAAKAGGNDAFWKFADLLFKNQPVDPLRYGVLAAQAQIPGDAFASCYASAQTTVDSKISADRENALTLGARGTPYSVILVNGTPVTALDGAYPYEAVKRLVDSALAR